jgi:L-malate glycosyltransferase
LKVGIYQQPNANSLGGSEIVSAAFATLFQADHDVEFLDRRPWVTNELLSDFTGFCLDRVQVKFSDLEPASFVNEDNRFIGRLNAVPDWMNRLSDNYDLFIASVHNPPPTCFSPRGVVYVHFPFWDRYSNWLWSGQSTGFFGSIKNRFRRIYYEKKWMQHLDTYQTWMANSAYSAGWTAKRWGPKCRVVPPPVRPYSNKTDKQPQILMLGRFVPSKRQLEVIQAYSSIHAHLPGWTLMLVGGLGTSQQEQEYFQALKEAAGMMPVQFLVNASRNDVEYHLQISNFFIHAMGYGVDLDTFPELAEHFGIATVEAMSAGCIPFVLNCGGQAEIVRHERDGILWNNLEELAEHLLQVAQASGIQHDLRVSAMNRAQNYSMQQFRESVQNLLRVQLN